jgi:NAD+ synthase (glutamine-hydrolysing)
MTPRICTIGIAQISPRLGDVEHNLALYEESVRQARERNVDLLVFPELSLTGYILRDLVSSVALQRGMRELDRLAALSRDVALVAGLVEEANGGLFYNAAMYFDGGHLQNVHRKVYLPTYGMFDEQRYFARGNSIRAFDTRFGRVATLICEDLWHPSTASIAALDGATIIICPSASPLRGVSEGTDVDDNARYWELLNQFYATTLGVFTVYANRVGFEDGVGFWGGSQITDPFGERLAKARYYETDFIAAEVSQDTARRKRVVSPMVRDEDLDLTINELLRLRGRPQALVPAPSEARLPDARRRATKPARVTSKVAARGKRPPARGGTIRPKAGAAGKAARATKPARPSKPARATKSTGSRRRTVPVRKRTKRR